MILVMNLFCSLVDIILPLFQRICINHFIEGNTLTGIGFFTVLYIVVIALQGAAVIAFTRGSMRIEMGLGKDLKRALFVHLQTLSFSYYNVTPVGYMLSRVMNDTGKISGLIAWNFVDLLWALTYVLGVFVAMLFLNWKLALVIMLVVPAIALLTFYFQNRFSNGTGRCVRSIQKSPVPTTRVSWEPRLPNLWWWRRKPTANFRRSPGR